MAILNEITLRREIKAIKQKMVDGTFAFMGRRYAKQLLVLNEKLAAEIVDSAETASQLNLCLIHKQRTSAVYAEHNCDFCKGLAEQTLTMNKLSEAKFEMKRLKTRGFANWKILDKNRRGSDMVDGWYVVLKGKDPTPKVVKRSNGKFAVVFDYYILLEKDPR